MINERNILIWFSHLGNINYEIICSLKEYFGSLEYFWNAKEKHIDEVLYKNRIIADKIIQNRSEKMLLSIIESTFNKDFNVMTITDSNYPEKLLNIYSPPYVLYSKGLPIEHMPMIGVVGSRKATAYGKWAAYNFSKELVKWGVCVVSGMALGIDSEGHKGALDGDGYTIAVLGCGINTCYPSSNIGLMNRIIENGTIISEYPPNILPLKHHFPARNRIISGLSDGIVVMEAAEKSGSLITVEYGLEQGKDIFALPGNINSSNSSGTNRLIKDGAKIILTIEDIIEELKIKYPYISNMRAEKVGKLELSNIERKVYEIINKYPMHIDMICYKSKLDTNEIRPILKVLELKGYIRQLPGKIFTVVI